MSQQRVVQVSKLKGAENYSTWASYTEVQLHAAGVWKHVVGEAVAPAKPDPELLKGLDVYQQHLFNRDYDTAKEAFDREFYHAAELIYCSLNDEYQVLFQHLKIKPKELWDTIATHFSGQGFPLIYKSAISLINTHYGDCKDVNDYNSRFSQHKRDLEALEVKVDDKLAIAFSMAGLGPKFESWSSRKRAEGKDGKLTWATLISQVVEEEQAFTNYIAMVAYQPSVPGTRKEKKEKKDKGEENKGKK
jgi:hypothetical protein